jgi:cation diffusion facilitator CzcD-associated flavoprotein CzcO
MGTHRETEVLVVGTGFSGLGMAIELKRTGRDFAVLEKAADVGGTWRDNRYPGCACDIPSHVYSFSFEQKPDWSRSYAPQPEIWDYLKHVTDKHDLRRHITFGAEVAGARWDAEERVWHVSTTSGDTWTARSVVAGVGALHLPNVPRLPGIENFRGETFHSARWNHDYDLRGKRVAVVGTGASAVQFVPRIAPEVARLTLFQRTPPWIIPKGDRAVRPWRQRLFRALPAAQRVFRAALYWALESRAIAFTGASQLMKVAQKHAERHIRAQVRDPEIRRKLTPDYTMGCKRVLISNDYYPTFNRDNVDLVTDGVAEVREHSIVDSAGVEHEVDAIVYGTGFQVIEAFDHLDLTGRDGRNIAKEWQQRGAETYYGITVSGYPNLYFLLGPNTGLGHNSVVFMIESQVRYVSQCLSLLDEHRADAIEVRADVQERFNRDLQRKLRRGVWSEGGCVSWYLDERGVNRTVWPGFTFRYWMRTRKVDTSAYVLSARRERVPV